MSTLEHGARATPRIVVEPLPARGLRCPQCIKLVLAATLAAVCASLAGCGELLCSNDDQACIESWDDNADSEPYVPPVPTLDQSYAHFACGTDGFNCVASGGTYDADLRSNDWTMKLAPSGALSVESMKAEGDVAHIRFRASGTGDGGAEFHGTYQDDIGQLHQYDPVMPKVHVLEVRDVTIASTEDVHNKYTFESADRAIPANGEAFVQLLGAKGQPLIDTTTHTGAGSDASIGPGTGASLANYARFTVGAEPGPRHVVVEGDSFATRTFDLSVAGTTDHITGDVVQTPSGPGADGVICFHTYWQGHEVPRDAVAFTFTSDNLTVGSHDNLGANCRHIHAIASGSASAIATIDGLTARVAFTVP